MFSLILDAAAPGAILVALGGSFLVLLLIVALLVFSIIFIVRKVKRKNQKCHITVESENVDNDTDN